MFRRTILAQALPVIVLIALTLLLWLPFGFDIGFTGDGWYLFANTEQGFLWGVATRPLLSLPHELAYWLTPNSFVGWNIVLAAVIAVRALSVYGILMRLRADQQLALLAAALTTVYPADTGLFYFGALTVYLSGAAYLVAVYCLLAAVDRPSVLWYAGMWVALLICVGSYEANYALIAVTPALVLLTRPHLDRRWRGLTLRWYLFSILFAIYYIFTVLRTPDALTYQSGLRASLAPLDVIGAIGFIYARHFVNLWGDFSGVTLSVGIAISAAAAGLVIGIAVATLKGEHSTPLSPLRRAVRPVELLMCGLVMIGVGMAVLLPSSVRTETLRTYFVTSAGAALVIAVLVTGISSWNKALSSVTGAALVAACALLILSQHGAEVRWTETQQRALGEIATLLPSLAPDTGLVFIDLDRTLDERLPQGWQFAQPFLVVYPEVMPAAILCVEVSSGPQGLEEMTSTGSCRFAPDGFVGQLGATVRWSRSYEQIIVVEYTDEQFRIVEDLTQYAGSHPAAAAYNPEALIDRSARLPERVCTLFTVNPCP